MSENVPGVARRVDPLRISDDADTKPALRRRMIVSSQRYEPAFLRQA